MMAGMLLARAGVDVLVLEKHADFLRDFRGDTIHPSTLEVMGELGLLEAFLREPHQEVTHLAGNVGDTLVRVADFTHLPTRCKFLAFMPQWEFLNFIATAAKRYPSFDVRMGARVVDLLWEGDTVAGVRAQTPQGPLDVRADLVIAADGRESVVRARAGLQPIELGAPMDVLWLRLSKRASDPAETFGYIRGGRIVALIDRGAYWQCAYVIPKGSLAGLARARHGRVSGGHRRDRAVFGRSRGRTARLGRRKAAYGSRQPIDALVSARLALHRRCGARDVADRRRRHQPRHPGCDRGGESSRGKI